MALMKNPKRWALTINIATLAIINVTMFLTGHWFGRKEEREIWVRFMVVEHIATYDRSTRVWTIHAPNPIQLPRK